MVNNAGIMTAGGDDHPQNPEHCSLEDWRKVLVINLDGVFLGCKYAIELMKKHSGSIVNVGSRSAFKMACTTSCGAEEFKRLVS